MTLEKHNGYRKNFLLIVIFIILISILFITSLFFAFSFSRKYIENKFVLEKVNVLEQSIKPYNEFFQNKLPEVSYYNGYLDSTAAAKFVDSITLKYPFITKVIFYDSEVKNTPVRDGINTGYFSFGPKAIYQFGSLVPQDSIKLFSQENLQSFTVGDEFNALAVKLVAFVEGFNASEVLSQDKLFSNFSIVRSNKITYLNIPSAEDLDVYQQMMEKKLRPSPVYQQDMFSFHLDPYKIKIVRNKSTLYQNIRIEPLTYEPLEASTEYISTEIALPGAFSDYKLYFISSKSFIKQQIFKYFFPMAIGLFLVYGILLLVAYLIFRDMNINSKMFKLQYDFVTNLTHEFKTPVSVIKIAGNNIKSSAEMLSEQELKHYGKILDEEADKLNGLMNRILAFTQIENKALRLNKEEINIKNFIANILEVHQLKHPDFELSYDVFGFENFNTDPVLLGSLFDNLVENAYKYSKSGNKILHISAKQIKGNVVFRFKDKGIGIAASEINNIFKKFFRIQNQYNQNGSVGLGLAFCKELVKFMDGEISVKSKVGQGSEFKIVLPYNN